MKILIITIGLFSCLATFIPKINSNKWWIRGFEFPHAQLTFLSMFSLICFFFYNVFSVEHILFFILLISTITYQLIILIPYTVLGKKQVENIKTKNIKNRICVLSANVYMHNSDRKKLKDLIFEHNPDIIALLETNHSWVRDMGYLKEKYPYYIELPQDNTYGMLYYSKLPIKEKSIKYLVEKNVPSIHAKVVLNNSILINTHCLHPKPPSPTQNETSTNRDIELLTVAKEVAKHDNPTIVMGDLNDVAWSSTTRKFLKISNLLDPRIGRGFYNTFHVKFPFLRWPLDHFFVSHHFNLVRMTRLKNIGSDHFPILIELVYNGK